ncbi:MAG: (Fe-S)-binding protein [Nitrospirae bacterium]|nr:(Fe-S)-binding protein [Nitrospirota bacterium]
MENESYLHELMKCVRCGSCKAYCPTYEEEITESMGARGRLVLLYELSMGHIKPSYRLIDRIFSCILCGACSGTCPLGIDIKEVIYHGRTLLKKPDVSRRLLRLIVKLYVQSPDLCFRLFKASQFLLPKRLNEKILPFPLELPESPFKSNRHVFKTSNNKKRGRIAVFTGCVINFLYPHLAESLTNVLQQLHYDVIFPAGEVCCGVPLRSLGLEDEAKRLAKRNLNIFKSLNVKAILSLCPTCTLALKVEYPKLIGEGIENIMDISSFFIDKLGYFHPLDNTLRFKEAVYHDPCHLSYGLGVTIEPREILKNIGLNLKEAEREGCCGFGGIFSLTFQELSGALLNKRTNDLKKTDAKTIITSCPGCFLQLSRNTENIPVLHLIEVIKEAI